MGLRPYGHAVHGRGRVGQVQKVMLSALEVVIDSVFGECGQLAFQPLVPVLALGLSR